MQDHNQLLHALLSFTNQLEEVVFWACTANYSKLLYVNDAYEIVFGRPKAELYNNLRIWAETIIKEDLVDNINELRQRMVMPGISSMGFRIMRPDGEIRYIKNTSASLHDETGSPSIIVGIDECLTPERWAAWLKIPDIEKKDLRFLQDFATLFQSETDIPYSPALVLNSQTIYVKNKPIKLTQREMECLKLILCGHSSKQIAFELDLSVRTVEIHMNNILKKSNIRTKFELISQLQYHHL